jgi:phosphoribosylamine--glycine ligase
MIGEKIFIDEKGIESTGSKLFYAAVNKENDFVKTTSSRSLAIVGISDILQNAEKICEKALTFVKGDHIFIRHDIGTAELIQKRVKHMDFLRGL